MRWGILALLFILMAAGEARKGHHRSRHGNRSNSHPQPADEDFANHLSKHQDDQEECHRAALSKCGQTFLRAHKLLSYLDNDLMAFRTRCGLRTAFFECLKSTREKMCSRLFRHPLLQPDFRKRLTDALWSTRICVLGIPTFAH